MKIFMHLGTHKTGSTSLQNWLRKNADVLLNQNIFFPSEGDCYGTTIGGLHSIFHEARNSPFNGGGLDDYLEAFETSNVAAGIISSEGLSRLNSTEVKNLSARLKKYEVIPVIVFRHPIKYLLSIYSSSPGAAKRTVDSKYFISNHHKNDIHNYDWMIKNWSRYFSNIKILDYEKEDNVISAFSKIIGVEGLGPAKESRLRSSLPFPLIEAYVRLRKLSGLNAEECKPIIYNQLIELNRSGLFDEFKLENFIPMSRSEQIGVLDHFKDSVNTINKHSDDSYDHFLEPISGALMDEEQKSSLIGVFLKGAISPIKVDYIGR